jgi:hypothetical protein
MKKNKKEKKIHMWRKIENKLFNFLMIIII